MRSCSRLAFVALPILALTSVARADNAPCPGIPTPVATAADLDAVRNNLGGNYIQVADIDLTNYAMTPIGDEVNPFTGCYDGQGYSITRFEYDGLSLGDDQVGLFGTADDAWIGNVNLVDVDVSGFIMTGGLVGHLRHGSVVDNCTVTGDLEGYQGVGGLIGRTHHSSVSRCRSKVNVLGLFKWAGGLIGHIHPGSTVRGCTSRGTVEGYLSVGGFAGNVHGSHVESCGSSATVLADSFAGGFSGYMQDEPNHATTVSRCWAIGSVESTGLNFIPGLWKVPATGGLIGYMEVNTVVEWSKASGAVVGPMTLETPAGGLVGFTEGYAEIRDSSASGSVISEQAVGGLVGWNEGIVRRCKASGDVEGTWSVGGFAGFTGGLLTLNPHSIVEDCSATGAVVATGAPNGHADPNHNIAAAGGFVGYVFPNCTFLRCLAEGDVTTTAQMSGGFAGIWIDSEADECYAIGDTYSSDRYIGGFIGQMVVLDPQQSNHPGDGSSRIENCYAHGDAIYNGTGGTGYEGALGGLVGEIDSGFGIVHHIVNGYSVGFVNLLHPEAGGLIGDAGAGTVVTSSYWDTQTSGQSTSDGGSGRTTAQMMTQANFVGWSFGPIWTIDPGLSYPYFVWQ